MSPLAMENWLPGLFAWMARATWQASVLAVLVLGVQWMLRRRLSAQVRCLLWAVVLLRLIAPPLPAGRWTLFPRQQPAAVISDKLATPAAPAPVAVAVPPTAHAATINPELVARLRTELASMPEVRDAESGIGALTGGLSLPPSFRR